MLKLPAAIVYELSMCAAIALAACMMVFMLLSLNRFNQALEHDAELELLAGGTTDPTLQKRSKSYKELIEIVDSLPPEKQAEWKTVRVICKTEMVLLMLAISMLSGMTQASSKLLLLSIADKASWGLILTFFLVLGIAAIIVLVTINVTMALYKQIDFVQLYTSFAIVFTMISGLCLFNEIQFYDAGSLSGVFSGCALCVIGVCLVAGKRG